MELSQATLRRILEQCGLTPTERPPELVARGASGSLIYRAWCADTKNRTRSLIVKIGRKWFINRQMTHHPRLEKCLGRLIPILYNAGIIDTSEGRFHYLVFEDSPGETLSSAVQAGRVQSNLAEPIIISLIDTLRDNLWLRSRKKGKGKSVPLVTPGSKRRGETKRQPLWWFYYMKRRFGARILSLPLKINTQSYNISMLGCLIHFSNVFSRRISHRCITHGDLTGNNILFTSGAAGGGEPPNFKLIDDRAGFNDWAYDIASLGYWPSLSVLTSLVARSPVTSGPKDAPEWALDFQVSYPQTCRRLHEICLEKGREIAEKLGDRDWQVRFYTYLGTASITAIAFVEERLRWGVLPLGAETYQNCEAFLLAEAARYCLLSKGAMSH